jgi:Fic family protein
MYTPKFTINQQILKNIGVIEACKEVITTAPLIPAWEKQFQSEAEVRTIHYGTHLEGNDLSLNQAREVIEGRKIVARGRDIQEVINYRNVLKYLDKLDKKSEGKDQTRGKSSLAYSIKTLRKIHSLVVKKILDEERAGKLRKTQVVVKDSRSGKVIFSPPKALEVPFQLEDFFGWLNSKKGLAIHSVLRAGIIHFELVRIHPFVDGNGRTARAFATLVLFLENYDIKRLFSLEEHFDKDALSYYQALQSVSKDKGEMTQWLEYFTQCLAIELTQVKEKIKKLSLDDKLKDKLGRQIALSERQIKLMEYLKKHEQMQMNQAKEILAKVSEDTILRDLKDLMKKGIVKKKGRTKAAVYILAS